MWFDQRLEVGRASSIDHLVCQYHHLESASYYRKPVKFLEEGGVKWEDLGRLNTRRAAAFWIRCKGLILEAGCSARSELQ